MYDPVAITIPREEAAMWARTYNNEDLDYGALPDACRQALQQEQVVLEVDFELDPTGTVERLVESFPGGPVRVTITPLEGEQDE